MIWKNNNFFIGALTALVLIIAGALLLILLVPPVYSVFNLGVPTPKILVLALLPPVIMMRLYMRRFKFEKAGAGSMFIIFLSMLAYFLVVAGKLQNFPAL